jgi:cell division septal protein FtsQ
MNKILNYFLKSFLFLFFIGTAVFVFYLLLKKNPSYGGITNLKMNKRISRDEIFFFLGEEFGHYNNKSFLFLNPQKIKLALKKHPLIFDAKVEHHIYPERQAQIMILEKEPWAIFESSLIDFEGKLITDSAEKVSNYPSFKKIYEDSDQLLQINSEGNFEPSEIQKLRKIVLEIEKILPKINPKDIFILRVEINKESNIELFSKTHRFKLGLFDEGILERVKRLKLVIKKLKELESEAVSEIEYVDLSLDTAEVLIGRKDVIKT